MEPVTFPFPGFFPFGQARRAVVGRVKPPQPAGGQSPRTAVASREAERDRRGLAGAGWSRAGDAKSYRLNALVN